FWVAQVRHALAVIDRYGERFVRMEVAQGQYVAAHDTKVSEVLPGGILERTPSPPRRIPDHELRQARRALVEAAPRFLNRCRAERLVAGSAVSAALAEFAE